MSARPPLKPERQLLLDLASGPLRVEATEAPASQALSRVEEIQSQTKTGGGGGAFEHRLSV
jgi:hypothetical protein